MIQKLFTDKFDYDTVINGLRCDIVFLLKFSLVYSRASVKWQFYNMNIPLRLTFFCKRGTHVDCPGVWPMDYRDETTHDCSFDIIISKCDCKCHNEV